MARHFEFPSLPFLDDTFQKRLLLELDAGDISSDPVVMCELALRARPDIDMFFRRRANYCVNTYDFASEELAIVFARGFLGGACLALGGILTLEFCDSDFIEPEAFVDNIAPRLPHKTKRERQRFGKVIHGNAIVDLSTKEIETSADLPRRYAQTYLDDAIYLYGLLEKEIQTARLDGNSEEHCDIYADGVNHGLETVIAMFVECHDELVLSQLES